MSNGSVFRTIVLAGTIAVSSFASAADLIGQGASFDVGFSPRAGALEVVLKAIASGRSQVLVAGYTFSSKPVAIALADAAKRGVKVYVVADKEENAAGYSAVTYLANHDVPVRLNSRYPKMHNKFMVVDNDTVQLGSMNYSAAGAARNAENVLVLWHVPAIAAHYGAEWKRLWDEAEQPLSRAY